MDRQRRLRSHDSSIAKSSNQTGFPELLDSGQFWEGFALIGHQKFTLRNRFSISDPTPRLFTLSFYGDNLRRINIALSGPFSRLHRCIIQFDFLGSHRRFWLGGVCSAGTMDNEYGPPRQRKKPKVKESIIDHTYRDYSQVEVSSDDEGASVTDDKKQSRLQPNFPAKLHAIVSNPNYQHIVCWQVRQCTLDLSHSFIFVITPSLTIILFRCNSLLAPREELEDRGKHAFIFSGSSIIVIFLSLCCSTLFNT